MNTILFQAILQSKVLELRYHSYSRIVEPHAYGRDKDGNEILRCYQTSGGSDSGESVGWKLLKVRDVFSLHLSDTVFSARPEYKRNDKAMDHVIAQL
jgi:hypothetical protein